MSNPLGQQVLSMLMQRSASGTGTPGQPASGDDDAGGAYAQQISELKGADPGSLLRQVKQIKQILSVMSVQYMERLPNVSGKIFKIIPQFDGVIKEIQQAQNVNQAVRNPVQMGAAQPSIPEGTNTSPGAF